MIDWFPIVLIVHLFGVLLWIGGLLAAGRVQLFRLDSSDPEGKLEALETRLFKSMAGHGMALALLGGLALVMMRPEVYGPAPWFRWKLLMVAVAIALHVALRKQTRRLSGSERPPRKLLVALNAAIAAVTVFIMILVFLQPW